MLLQGNDLFPCSWLPGQCDIDFDLFCYLPLSVTESSSLSTASVEERFWPATAHFGLNIKLLGHYLWDRLVALLLPLRHIFNLSNAQFYSKVMNSVGQISFISHWATLSVSFLCWKETVSQKLIKATLHFLLYLFPLQEILTFIKLFSSSADQSQLKWENTLWLSESRQWHSGISVRQSLSKITHLPRWHKSSSHSGPAHPFSSV